MVERIDNDGGSYGFYTVPREAYVYGTEAAKETYISHNRYERGTPGVPLGSGQYLHEGQPVAAEVQKLPRELESRNTRSHLASRIETRHSAPREANSDEERIVSATPNFDFMSGRAELVVRFASGRERVVHASNRDVLSWVQNQLVGRLV